jgi:hypothetical protein
MASWRGRLAVFASRGEVDGPRVAECKAALDNWRLHTFFTRECGFSEADALLAAAGLPVPGRAAPKTPGGPR